jgi:polyisoprenoid-binding protein YceI
MIKANIFAVFIYLFASSSIVSAAEYSSIKLDKSTLDFSYKQMGVELNGHFNKFTAQLLFDPAKLSSAKTSFDLDLNSIDAGSEEANDEVVAKEWFNTKVFPHAKFESTAFKSLGGNRFEVAGKMTIKGHTQVLVAPFVFNQQGSNAVADGSFVLKRADFAIGEGSWSDFGTVANEIKIKFHFITSITK